MFADTEFQPHACFFGGCLAQEAVKLAGKYNPLNQWCHLDCFEVLPEGDVTDGKPSGTRYDDHTIIFGAKLQEKLMNQKTFMVGCGALGCVAKILLWEELGATDGLLKSPIMTI